MIRVLLVIDIPFYREGLATLLGQCSDVTVVGAVASADAALKFGTAQSIDVALLDISHDAAHDILRRWRTLPNGGPVIALGISESTDAILEWARAGVRGYVSRSAGLPELLESLRYAVRGHAYCTPRIMSIVLQQVATAYPQKNAKVQGDSGTLTAREREILELVGKGLSNKVIALRLQIAHATAKNHVHHILAKLNLRSRSQMVAYLRSQERTAAAPTH
jgi:DNA-binding NarL/FixJ family response regulator